MKGIVLAGGTGSRLWPVTRAVSKQLLPIYNKPLVYYPISTLMLAKIREILIVVNPSDLNQFQELLGNGDEFGVRFEYCVQNEPRGIADAFLIGKHFIAQESSALILGDNIFYGQGLGVKLQQYNFIHGAQIFGYAVHDPERYGVVELDDNYNVLSIEEKPELPKSNLAVPGLYFYDNNVVDIAHSIEPSARGELEITAINQIYLSQNLLQATRLERGTAWFDTGTFDSMHAASSFIQIIEQRQGFMIACLEEIAWRNDWISSSQLSQSANKYRDSSYRNYLLNLANN
jgi:glucose-1-phosphate thymidylyltransferase